MTSVNHTMTSERRAIFNNRPTWGMALTQASKSHILGHPGRCYTATNTFECMLEPTTWRRSRRRCLHATKPTEGRERKKIDCLSGGMTPLSIIRILYQKLYKLLLLSAKIFLVLHQSLQCWRESFPYGFLMSQVNSR